MPNNIFGHAKQDYLRSNRRKPNNFGLGSPKGDIFNEVEPRSREKSGIDRPPCKGERGQSGAEGSNGVPG